MKIFCVGRNYAEHAQELKNEVPPEPVIFLKPKSALLMPGSQFYYPEFTNELHYEAELVLYISKNGKYIPEAQAQRYYDRISVGIDFTARDIQTELKKKGLPWEKAKAWDGSAVVGRMHELTTDMLKKPIEFSLKVNDELVQQGNSKDMLFSFNRIIADVSQYFALNIGDLIFTGTPAGVGECVVGDVLVGHLGDEKVFEFEIK
ncbi:fumarylacetoacetate hydrolase family protein [Parafilimonas terrae]|uniref:2-keto-4-pentenoate hydratase/2-oxohepta-3-ene-1,7-dioic acid hydratase (Catechol pathway) n=1 Tax=Parafilimonas terrae TaxID=1465490 RepID=A0A1I5YII6_9BACT|nr:fumarylacetoacetate hydrolase family protein [Parafilimonas terrae]SFQ44022.1 2-keto-4-pentenoate hydratase/2-oxohepta-3-ene-1,7-dioic acid hydratase (catechol pathway) [Parafilimonas terrae]